MLGNQARVSKPIEITARGILVYHQRRRKHPSVMRKIGNGLWSLNVERLNLELSSRFERSVAVERLERLERTDPRDEWSEAVERLERLELAALNPSRSAIVQ